MDLKERMKKIPFLQREVRKIRRNKKLTNNFKLFGKIKNKNNLVIILAGYKEFLWKDFFDRFNNFLPKDGQYEVCILSSGKYSERLKNIAVKNDWVYLSVKRNNVCLAQNVAINQFPQAKYIYKIDEDIFLTKGFFENLKKTYKEVNNNSLYRCGFVSPILPINGVGYVEILKKYNLISEYENKIHEKVKYSADGQSKIVKDPNAALFFWGKNSAVPSIDKMNNDFQKNKEDYKVAPSLVSIGAVMFERKSWEKFDMFPVHYYGNDMGADEQKLNDTFNRYKSVIISMHSVVGHFSYGPQTKVVRKYYEKNPDTFKIQEY